MTDNSATPTAGGAPVDQVSLLGHVAYHVRCAAGLASEGRNPEAAPHTLLAWALFDSSGADPVQRTLDALDLPDQVGDVRSPLGGAARHQAAHLAVQLVAHFTSEGRHDLADLYQRATNLLTSPT